MHLADNSGDWKIQTAWCQHPDKGPLDESQHVREVERKPGVYRMGQAPGVVSFKTSHSHENESLHIRLMPFS
jgi:hypothetical protein